MTAWLTTRHRRRPERYENPTPGRQHAGLPEAVGSRHCQSVRGLVDRHRRPLMRAVVLAEVHVQLAPGESLQVTPEA